MSNNPLIHTTKLPNHAPAFDSIKNEHYLPAVEAAIAEARGNVDNIKADANSPTFDNTIVALETASELLGQVAGIFYNQLSAMGGDELHDLVEKIGPLNANFSSDVMLDADLFARIKSVHDQRETLDLDTEQTTLLDETYRDFVRCGSRLDDE